MPRDEAKPPAGSEKRARRQRRVRPPIDIDRESPPPRPSPTDRIEKAKDAHIEQLDQERRRLVEKVEQLQSLMDRLGPENARLNEALGNAVANNVLATILVGIGGGSISFATFAEAASKAVAYVGAALLVSGVLILLVSAFRGRRTKPAQPR